MQIESSLEQRETLLFSAATIAAHSQSDNKGFRQRDVRFLLELFSNWLHSSLHGGVIPVKNTQISRYLTALVKEGYVRQFKRAIPHYRVTRIGLVELISRLVQAEYVTKKEYFFFVFYFIKNYKPILYEMIAKEGKQFPTALKIELDSLFDLEKLIDRETSAATRELRRIEVRIRDSLHTSECVTKGLKQGKDFERIVQEVEERFPYELNSTKPLSELISQIPPQVRQWELKDGTLYRSNEIWNPMKRLLKSYIRELENLKTIVAAT